MTNDNRITLHKKISTYSEDTTKNCGLLPMEVDNNFMSLKEYDIKSFSNSEQSITGQTLNLTRVNGGTISINTGTHTHNGINSEKITHLNLTNIGTKSHTQLEVDLSNLSTQLSNANSGYLGDISYKSVAPTPSKNGFYKFSDSGTITGSTWLSMVGTNVSIFDEVSVRYISVGVYTYTYLKNSVTLSDAIDSTSQTTAASSFAVKTLNDKINVINITNSDLDTIIGNGSYGGYSMTNTPNNSNSYFYLRVIGHWDYPTNQQWCKQFLYSYGEITQETIKDVYSRELTGGVWNDWKIEFNAKELLSLNSSNSTRQFELSGKKIILYGDSRSYYQPYTDIDHPEMYPWYKNRLAELTEAIVEAKGWSGRSTQALATNDKLQNIFSSDADVVIILVGGNNSGSLGTVGTFGLSPTEPIVLETNINLDFPNTNEYTDNGGTFIQAVSHIIRKIKNNYYNIRSRANLSGTETEYEKTLKIDSVKNPYFVICTDLPQKRNNSDDEFSKKENWERKRLAIIECCQKYNFPYIDLYNECSFDMSIEPYWTSPTDFYTNNGIYFMDGLHPNKYGAYRIADIISASICNNQRNIISYDSYQQLSDDRFLNKLKINQTYSFPYVCIYRQPVTGIVYYIDTNLTMLVKYIGGDNHNFDKIATIKEHTNWYVEVSMDDFEHNYKWGAWDASGCTITKLIDQNNNEAHYDFKNIKFRRWELTSPSYNAGTTYNEGDFVLYSNSIYLSKAANIGKNPDTYRSRYWVKVLDVSITKYLSSNNSGIPINFINKTYTIPTSGNYIDFYTFSDVNGNDVSSDYRVTNNKITILDYDRLQINNIVNIGTYIQNNNFKKSKYSTIIGTVQNSDLFIESCVFSKEIKQTKLYGNNSVSCVKINGCNIDSIENTVLSYENKEFFVGNNIQQCTNSILEEAFENSNISCVFNNNIISLATNSNIISCENKIYREGFYESSKLIQTTPIENKMNWWREAKYGLFIHWGLFSVLEGEYSGPTIGGGNITLRAKDTGVGAEWIQKLANIPREIYSGYTSGFTASSFDPDLLAYNAINVGLKYVILTVKHHEGFLMFKTNVTPYNISLTSAPIDIVNNLKDACRSRGLKFGVYYSQNVDWHHIGGYSSEPYMYPSENTYTNRQNYVENNVIPILREIIIQFNPDILWYDIPSVNGDTTLLTEMNTFVNNYSCDTMIVNNRLGGNFIGDYDTPEGEFYSEYRDDNEICFTMNGSWGYDKYRTGYTESYILLNKIIESASRGGNALLNIGPKKDGTIVTQELTILNEIGVWMSINGECIYGTKLVNRKTHQTFGKLTKKGNILYAIIIDKNLSEITLDGIPTNTIVKVESMDSSIEYEYTQNNSESITITSITTSISNFPRVLKITTVSDIVTTDRLILSDTKFEYSSACIRTYGDAMIQGFDNIINIGNWNDSISKLKTNIKCISDTGTYQIYMNVLGGNYTTSVSFKIGDTTVTGETFTPSDGYNWDIFQYRPIGSINLIKGVTYPIEISKTVSVYPMNFKSFKLIKI